MTNRFHKIPVFFSDSPSSDRNLAKAVYWIGLHACVLGHFSSQFILQNLIYSRFHGHLQRRNYDNFFKLIKWSPGLFDYCYL